MSLTGELHAISGELGHRPVGGRVPAVAIIPDDYLPPQRYEGPLGTSVAAGGAGTRTEIALVLASLDPNIGCELADLWVSSATAGASVEILRATAGITGLTDVPFVSGDLGSQRPRLRLQYKNTAAATAGTDPLVDDVIIATANVYVRLPGSIILRGKSGQNAIIIRTKADNQNVKVLGRYRDLEKRSL